MLKLTESAVHVRVTGPQNELYLVSEKLRFRPPNFWRADSYQIHQQTDGAKGWDGYLYPLKIAKPTDGAAPKGLLLRGLKAELFAGAAAAGVQLDTSGLLVSPFSGLVADDLPEDLIQGAFQLDEDQRRCVTEWLSQGIGINQAVVNSGKTAMFAAAASAIKRKFPNARILYFTASERLVNQSMMDFETFIPDLEISQFGGGKRDYSGKDMVVATAASIHRNFKKLDAEGWFKSFMCVMSDEVHHCASPSIERWMLKLPAFFRFGASDQIKHDDLVASQTVRGLVGPIVGEIEHETLMAKGRSAKPKIYLIDKKSWHNKFRTSTHAAEIGSKAWCLLDGEWKSGIYEGPVFEPAEPGKDGLYQENEDDGLKKDKKGEPIPMPNYHSVTLIEDGKSETLQLPSRWCLLDRLYDNAIIRFKERNDLILQWAEHFSGKGWPTLIVCTRTLHVKILETSLRTKLGSKVKSLFSEHSTKERDRTFQWFKTTPGAVLVTPLVKEGVSINEIKAGIIADPIAGYELARQVIGRFVRKKKEGENEAHIVWFIDRQHPNYRSNGYQLFEKLEEIRGFEFYHPVTTPEDLALATKYAGSLPEPSDI